MADCGSCGGAVCIDPAECSFAAAQLRPTFSLSPPTKIYNAPPIGEYPRDAKSISLFLFVPCAELVYFIPADAACVGVRENICVCIGRAGQMPVREVFIFMVGC